MKEFKNPHVTYKKVFQHNLFLRDSYMRLKSKISLFRRTKEATPTKVILPPMTFVAGPCFAK